MSSIHYVSNDFVFYLASDSPAAQQRENSLLEMNLCNQSISTPTGNISTSLYEGQLENCCQRMQYENDKYYSLVWRRILSISFFFGLVLINEIWLSFKLPDNLTVRNWQCSLDYIVAMKMYLHWFQWNTDTCLLNTVKYLH